VSVIRCALNTGLKAAAVKRIPRTLLFCFALLVWSAFAAKAGQIEDGIAAYHTGDYATALKLLRPLAERGDATAQDNLGVIYAMGQGVAYDYKEALKWFRLAAERGNAAAQDNLGVMHAKGQGVAHDYKEAMKWFRAAAAQGNEAAQANLGVMYAKGLGVAQDYVRAHLWFNVAALSLQGERRKSAADNRDAIAAKMTSAQIEQAQALARTCLQSNYKECD
jgi:uncharacterized protein